ncbi:Uncharacterised protein [Serratia fonticola]|uniref:Uncharacterized protein n=1 Tax=Serratia fonticola TaxID=47917 RepID=A0A4V6KR73_SERFO|nr:Uncharacterised protein [Serratia fonticola]
MKNANAIIKSAIFAALAIDWFLLHMRQVMLKLLLPVMLLPQPVSWKLRQLWISVTGLQANLIKLGHIKKTQDLTLGISGCKGALKEGGAISANGSWL